MSHFSRVGLFISMWACFKVPPVLVMTSEQGWLLVPGWHGAANGVACRSQIPPRPTDTVLGTHSSPCFLLVGRGGVV